MSWVHKASIKEREEVTWSQSTEQAQSDDFRWSPRGGGIRVGGCVRPVPPVCDHFGDSGIHGDNPHRAGPRDLL